MYEVIETDWKLFRARLPGWQERYMDRLCHEYIKLLSADKPAWKRFWALEKRVKWDKKKVGVVAEMRRSRLWINMLSLLDEGAITMEDLDGFSDSLKENLKMYLDIRHSYMV